MASQRPLIACFSVTRSGPSAGLLMTRFHPNPNRHDVTIMAPQDFPLCAAFQEE